MTPNPYGQFAAPSQVGVRPDARLAAAFLTQSFFWMFLGLLVTTAVGVLIASLPEETLLEYAWLAIPMIFVQLGLAFTLTLAIKRISATVGLLLFFVYAAITGVTLGIVLITYELGSVLAAGSSAAAVFGAAAIYGAVTKRNLTGLGPYLFMGLIGLIVVMFLQLFFFADSSTASLIIGILGVIIFTGLTAWDVQRLKNGAIPGINKDSATVMGALTLYLDFVNIFLMLLRIFGSSR